MTLCKLRPGQRARISGVGGSGAIRQRLLDMGLLPREIIKLLRVAPTGDPLWISLRGYQLSLRRSEAAEIRIVSEEL